MTSIFMTTLIAFGTSSDLLTIDDREELLEVEPGFRGRILLLLSGVNGYSSGITSNNGGTITGNSASGTITSSSASSTITGGISNLDRSCTIAK
jgi:hypothetical protein